MNVPVIAGGGLLLLTFASGGLLLARDVAGQQLLRRIDGLQRHVPDQSLVTPASIRRARQHRHRLLDRVLDLLGYKVQCPEQYVIAWPIVACVAGAIGLLTWYYGRGSFGVFTIPLAVGDALLSARFVFRYQSRKYATALLKQMPDALGIIVRGSSVGIPVGQAVHTIATETAEPTSIEFTRMVDEVAVGASVDTAIWNIYRRTGVTEYSFLAVALGLQQQSGGNFSETLENLADMVRKRLAMVSRAKALSSESRAAAAILAALPFLMSVIVSIEEPGYMDPLFGPKGFWLLKIAVGMLAFGLIVIRWLIRKASEG